MGLAFPVAALVAAVLVFATSSFEVGLVFGLIAALIPWALLAGDVRVGPWTMVAAGIFIPGAVVAVYDAPGAIFLALLAVAWLAANGESLAAEITGLIGGAIVIPILYAAQDWADEREAFVYFATGGLITWCIGRILRRERQLVAALTEAQARLQSAASAAERQRIARDVHDVVGHSLTVMLLNVTGARRVLNDDPAAAAEALDRAEQAGRGSLQSVRAIVGLLRTPDEAGAQPPRPGAADIVGLVDTAAAAGRPAPAVPPQPGTRLAPPRATTLRQPKKICGWSSAVPVGTESWLDVGTHDRRPRQKGASMDPVTRRSFLIKGSAGAAGAAGLAAGGFTLASAAAAADTAEPALRADEAADVTGPVLVEIKDAATGEVEILVGEREVSFTDKALVAKVLRAAR